MKGLHDIMKKVWNKRQEAAIMKRTPRRLLSIAICTTLLLGMIPTTVFSAGKSDAMSVVSKLTSILDTETTALPNSSNSSITYDYDETTKTLTITGKGPMDDYQLVEPEGFFNVRPPWYSCYGEAEKIIIGDGITHIGEHAFYERMNFHGCTALKELVIGDGVESIGKEAFSGCTSLEKVTFGKSIRTIAEYAFTGCRAVKQVHIPDIASWCGVNYEGLYSNPLSWNDVNKNAYLYLNEQKLTNLIIPEGVTEIVGNSFEQANISRVVLPSTLKKIGAGAF